LIIDLIDHIPFLSGAIETPSSVSSMATVSTALPHVQQTSSLLQEFVHGVSAGSVVAAGNVRLELDERRSALPR
jgi:hypothetical protein